MIYLFYGNGTLNKQKAYDKLIKTISKDTDTVALSRNGFDKMSFESLYSSSSLFSAKSIVLASGLLEHEETREFILEKLPLIASSANDFVFLEGKLNKPVTDAFKKVRAEINIFELPKAKLEKFDNFLLASAFANKDKLNSWIYFRQAVDLGVALEEMTGVLFWKLKDMILKKNFSKFKESELKDIAARLSYILPEARSSGRDAEAALEQFLLEAF
jgi:hypothetical protein